MRHTVEDLVDRISAMKTKAIELYLLRTTHKKYDQARCQALLDDIQTMAQGIAEDRAGDEILTRLEQNKNGDPE